MASDKTTEMQPGNSVSKPSRSRVAVVKGSDIEASVRKSLDLISGMQKFIRSGDTVLIKPNFGVAAPAETGIITDPLVVEALVKTCRDTGAKKIIVAESSVVGFDTGKVFEALQLTGRFEKYGAELVNLDQDRIIEVPVRNGAVLKKLKLFQKAYESDVLISVPTMKTHILTGVTLGLKNMKGILPDIMKKTMHRIGVKEQSLEFELEHAIADLNSVRKPEMTVIDGFTANEGFKPGTPGIGGSAVKFDTVVAGFDPVATDTVGAYLMGFGNGEVKHIVYAGERGLGVSDLNQIDILGENAGKIRYHFERPSIEGIALNFSNLSFRVGDKGCSGCRESYYIAVSGMSEAELATVGKAVVVMGQNADIPESDAGKPIYLLGNCSMKSGLEGELIEGCPPPGIFVKKYLLGQSL